MLRVRYVVAGNALARTGKIVVTLAKTGKSILRWPTPPPARNAVALPLSGRRPGLRSGQTGPGIWDKTSWDDFHFDSAIDVRQQSNEPSNAESLDPVVLKVGHSRLVYAQGTRQNNRISVLELVEYRPSQLLLQRGNRILGLVHTRNMTAFGSRPTSIISTLIPFIAAACVHPTPRTSIPVPVTGEDIAYFSDHPLMVPVDGVPPNRVPDSFHEPRGEKRIHNATDILAPRETPVVAAIAGKVMRLRQNAAGGITAYLIDKEGRYIYYYAHLSHYSDKVTEGLDVPQGFVIGYVGTSGNAPPDTPHLHFQAMRYTEGHRDWWNGTPVDVRPFMKITGKAIE
jgi:hypothetical protein